MVDGRHTLSTTAFVPQEKRIAIRLPSWLLAAVDAETQRQRARRPAAVVNRSDVIRVILARALAAKDATEDAEHERA